MESKYCPVGQTVKCPTLFESLFLGKQSLVIVVQFAKLAEAFAQNQVKGPSYSHQALNLCDLHVYLTSLRLSMWKISGHLVRLPLFDERSWAGGALRSLVLVSCLLLTHLSKTLDSPLFPTDAATSPSWRSVDYYCLGRWGAWFYRAATSGSVSRFGDDIPFIFTLNQTSMCIVRVI